MVKYLMLVLFAVVFVACSGKVQTNPEPNPTKYKLPNKKFALTTSVKQTYIDDYKAYAEEFLKKHIVEYSKSIWTIGIERGRYE